MAIYYVRPVNGSDANDGLSFANAFQTTQAAMDVVASGDEVRLCAEGTEAVAATITTSASGLRDSRIKFAGWLGDGSAPLNGTAKYVLSGSSIQGSSSPLWQYSHSYYEFYDVEFTGAPGPNITASAAFVGDHSYTRCKIANGGAGLTPSGTMESLYECEVSGNALWGIQGFTASTGAVRCVATQISGNGSGGVSLGRNNTDSRRNEIIQCRIFDNGGSGLELDSFRGNFGVVKNCTVYGNSGDGIKLGGAEFKSEFVNNTSVGNGGYGYRFTNDPSDVPYFDGNHSHGNTSGHTNLSGGLPGIVVVTGDPLFADATSGDFTPSATSPLRAAGIGGVDIGAVRAADPAGGGGGGTRAFVG